MVILVTGGLGYIGSHTCVELLNEGNKVVIVDNLSNSKLSVLNRIESITGIRPVFYQLDLLDKGGLNQVFELETIDAVIHFAALKAVGESVALPLKYYKNNLVGAINLLEVMEEKQVQALIFSSSATVYGMSDQVPYTEDTVMDATNPYGYTKIMIEQFLKDLSITSPKWKITALRYFNPVGAHKSGLIGEDPCGIPNNLMPMIAKVATKELEQVKVFGTDYSTPDGTGVRDYIHVVDLAKGHIKALNHLEKQESMEVINLGTGNGFSVLEMIETFKSVNQVDVPYVLTKRRPGDIAASYASTLKAERVLGWQAKLGLEAMCQDVWRWQQLNPRGYED